MKRFLEALEILERNRKWVRFPVAALVVILAVVVRVTLLESMGTKAPYITFYPAVIVAAQYGGLWGGLVASALSGLLSTYWIPPIGEIGLITDPVDWLSMTVFLSSCLLISWVGEVMNRTQARLKKQTVALTLMRDKAEAANNAKTAFLANMSHELRTPLNSILGYSEMLTRKEETTTDQRVYLNIINRSGAHLLELINEVLELAKIESKGVEIIGEQFDWGQLLNELKEMFQETADQKKIELKFEMEADGPVMVMADRKKLKGVLINLIGNSLKFTGEGSVRMVSKFGLISVNGRKRLHVDVFDTGVGIPNGEIDKIFNIFEQTDAGRSKNSGTGLGLPISQRYIEAMGGKIFVESEVGKGSHFYFQIDVGWNNKNTLLATENKRVVKALAPGTPMPKVLVAEDHKENRELLCTILKERGFLVQSAEDGGTALELSKEWKPDLIWMDIRMPVMDGKEATRRIKESGECGNVIILALTAHAMDEEIREIRESGFHDVVRKPYHEDEIFDMMAKYLDLKYIYEEDGGEGPVKKEVSWDEVVEIPPEIMRELKVGTLALDMERIRRTAQEIERMNSDFGRIIQEKIEQYEYTSLLQLAVEYEKRREQLYEN